MILIHPDQGTPTISISVIPYQKTPHSQDHAITTGQDQHIHRGGEEIGIHDKHMAYCFF